MYGWPLSGTVVESELSSEEAIAELEDATACDIVSADKAQAIADPFVVELDVTEMYRLSQAVPVFQGERQRGMSVTAIVETIVRELGYDVETPQSTGLHDDGFLARAKYEHNLPTIRNHLDSRDDS